MHPFIKSYWIHIVAGVASVLTLLLAAILFFVNVGQPTNSDSQDHLDEWLAGDELPEEVEEEHEVVQPIIVDVKGAVMRPGIYELAHRSRVVDAINAAGGVSDTGDANQLNYAMILEDEMQIYVPEEGEEWSNTPSQPTVTSSAEQNGQVTGSLVNINTAMEAELETLNGVGPSKSASIIAYREEHGPFKTIEDLMNVSGIGEKSFEKLKLEITVQ